jgi:hypothetical protein
MRTLTEDEFQQRLKELLSSSNKPVKTPCPHGPYTPKCLYLYYVSYTRFRVPEVKVYFYDYRAPLSGAALKAAVKGLTENAREGGDAPPKCGTIFEAVHWQCKSYFALVVDDDEYYIKDNDSVVFDDSNGKTPNHTFFDGQKIDISVKTSSGGTEQLSALVCINHMFENDLGQELGPNKRQYFIYNIYVGSRSSHLVRREDVIDPGGTNLGPPITPP